METPTNSDQSDYDADDRFEEACIAADEPQTAMLLTEDEWSDLAMICHFWLYEHGGPGVPGKQADLCRRIKDACR